MPTPTIFYSSFLLPKSDSNLEQCEDALCTPIGCEPSAHCECKISQEESRLRFAVADGVTTSFYSGCWAAQLVELFRVCPFEKKSDIRDWKKIASSKWVEVMKSRELGTISQNRLVERDPASSTFCGIEIKSKSSDSNEFLCSVFYLGDSCCFHFSKQRNSLRVFPYSRSSDFKCITEAVSSYDENTLPQHFLDSFPEIDITQGDLILLATDALSEWMMRCEESEIPVWKSIADLKNQDDFKQIVQSARREEDIARRLKDDDVALIVISIGEPTHSFLDNQWVYEPGKLKESNLESDCRSEFGKFISTDSAKSTAPI